MVGTDTLITWLGHASFKIEADDKIIYIDPYEGDYQEKADFILVTHSHHDHCDVAKIAEARKESSVVVAPSDCALKIGGTVESLQPGERLTVEGITIEAVDAYNYKRFRSPGTPFHPEGSGVGYLVTVKGKTIYHAGDTDLVPGMKGLKDVYVALLPAGDTYTMDNPEAAEAALAIKPVYAIPMHRLDTDPTEFKMMVESRSSTRVILLKPGERFEVE